VVCDAAEILVLPSLQMPHCRPTHNANRDTPPRSQPAPTHAPGHRQEYCISREQFDFLQDVTKWKSKSHVDALAGVKPATKSSFTRSFNKQGLVPKTAAMLESPKKGKKGKGRGRAAADEGEEEAEEERAAPDAEDGAALEEGGGARVSRACWFFRGCCSVGGVGAGVGGLDGRSGGSVACRHSLLCVLGVGLRGSVRAPALHHRPTTPYALLQTQRQTPGAAGSREEEDEEEDESQVVRRLQAGGMSFKAKEDPKSKGKGKSGGGGSGRGGGRSGAGRSGGGSGRGRGRGRGK